MRGFALSVVVVAGCAQLVGIRTPESGDDGGPIPPPSDGSGGSSACGLSVAVIPTACDLLGAAMPFDLAQSATFDTDMGVLLINGQGAPVSVTTSGTFEVIVAT